MAKRNTGVATKTRDEVPVTRGSGNVYADLGFANPAEELAKATLHCQARACVVHQ